MEHRKVSYHFMSQDDSRNFKDHNHLWKNLCYRSDYQRDEIEDYENKTNKMMQIPIHPICDYMDNNIFFVLTGILETTLTKARDTSSLQHQKSPFNAIDFIAEQLWNYNPKFPERGTKYISIHDMEWAKKLLEETPRPYFPFSYIWSRHFAAMKIQAYIRGYWVRSRDDVQEMRLFWKAIKIERTTRKSSLYNK